MEASFGTAGSVGAQSAVIDLNADLGEGVGDDAAMLGLVTSANVACGFHAGDEKTMRSVCTIAGRRGVAIGAHVSYRDRANFGRTPMAVTPDRLRAEVTEQLRTLRRVAAHGGNAVRYVKPHGALYNRAAEDQAQAGAIVAAITDVDSGLALLGPADSALQQAADAAGIRFVAEAFADRAYRADGQLVPRTEPGAVLDGTAAVAQALRIAHERRVLAADGSTISVEARSLCVHGDTPAAVEIARRIRAELADAGLSVAAFA